MRLSSPAVFQVGFALSVPANGLNFVCTKPLLRLTFFCFFPYSSLSLFILSALRMGKRSAMHPFSELDEFRSNYCGYYLYIGAMNLGRGNKGNICYTGVYTGKHTQTHHLANTRVRTPALSWHCFSLPMIHNRAGDYDQIAIRHAYWRYRSSPSFTTTTSYKNGEVHSRVMHDSSWHTYRSNQDLWLERTSAQMQTKPSGSASLSPHSRAVGSPAV